MAPPPWHFPLHLSPFLLPDCLLQGLPCHTALLAASSTLLKSLLSQEQEPAIHLPDFSKQEVEQLLSFLYGQQDSLEGGLAPYLGIASSPPRQGVQDQEFVEVEEPIPTYRCAGCDSVFTGLEDVGEHMMWCQGGQEEQQEQDLEVGYLCFECSEEGREVVLGSEGEYKQHLQQQHGEEQGALEKQEAQGKQEVYEEERDVIEEVIPGDQMDLLIQDDFDSSQQEDPEIETTEVFIQCQASGQVGSRTPLLVSLHLHLYHSAANSRAGGG